MDRVEPQPKKKPGRPRKRPEDDGRRSAHSVWLSEADRARVIAAADARGRSLSEEMADRIHESFERDDRAGGFANRALADMVISELVIVEAFGQRKWTHDAEAARYFHERLCIMLARAMKVDPLESITDEKLRKRAEALTVIARQHEDDLSVSVGNEPKYSIADDPLARKVWPDRFGSILDKLLHGAPLTEVDP